MLLAHLCFQYRSHSLALLPCLIFVLFWLNESLSLIAPGLMKVHLKECSPIWQNSGKHRSIWRSLASPQPQECSSTLLAHGVSGTMDPDSPKQRPTPCLSDQPDSHPQARSTSLMGLT